jgi:hypothetical protein
MDASRHDRVVAAVEAWFLGGPIDGRLMAVETTVDGNLPEVVRLPQTGMYVGTADVARPRLSTSTSWPTGSTTPTSTSTGRRVRQWRAESHLRRAARSADFGS